MNFFSNLLQLPGRYIHWLHTRWPAGLVERLPEVNEDGSTTVPGLFVVGDLTGIPLLKFAVDSGARVVNKISPKNDDATLDVAIIGGGVSGIAAALEAKKRGLRFEVFEAAEPFSTIINFPKGKHIFTYPTDFQPAGDLQITAPLKESLLEELEGQRLAAGIDFTPQRVEKIERASDGLKVLLGDKEVRKAHQVVVAIGRSGNYRKLGVPGEQLDKVSNRLHDPMDFAGKNVLVVGGGDSALEAAIALTVCGAHTTLSYRKKEFSRPKSDNLEKIQQLTGDPGARVQVESPTSERVTTAVSFQNRGEKPAGSLSLLLPSEVEEITEDSVSLKVDGRQQQIPNDAVFSMIGRQPPLDFFRQSGVPIRNEWRPITYVSFALFFAFCTFLYFWKAGHPLNALFKENQWFPFNVSPLMESVANSLGSSNILNVLKVSLTEPGFYYTLAYTLCIVIFGWRRIQRRKTPYVTRQTICLAAIQVVPLFFLPYLILPLLGNLGWFDAGTGKWFADEFFPPVNYGHGREYWRAFGFILAWPLFIWNVFTSQPMWGWLAVSFVQTFVIIPLIVLRWGKGAYCGWICSCGALAETLGDTHRQKMPHGPFWNRMNLVGQVILVAALLLLALRVGGWLGWKEANTLFGNALSGWKIFGGWIGFNYYFIVDIFLAGIVGVGLYFWFSGRVWCRFACPLAALMHIYARFTKFRIFSDKSKCISCNVCTSVCHQGIDVMNFANKGLPMEDPQCVRCSACVQSCPTGVLSFGRYDGDKKIVFDKVPASRTQMVEAAKH